MRDLPIYPKFYYCRGKVSDRDWIMVRMRAIPSSKQQEVADHYEKLYLSGKQGRKAANTYLQGVATEYRSERNAKQKAQVSSLQRVLKR